MGAFRHQPFQCWAVKFHPFITMSAPAPRGLLEKQIGRHLKVAIVLSTVAAVGWKLAINDPRKKLYADYYKDYDAQADFDRMRNLGLFQSCRPAGAAAEDDE